MRRRTIYYIGSVLLLLLMFLYANSYGLLLLSEGFNPGKTTVLYSGFEEDGKMFQVLCHSAEEVREKDIDQKVIRIQKTIFGIWRVTGSAADMPGSPSDRHILYADILMTEPDPDRALEKEFVEAHFVYAGKDAVKPIEVTEEIMNAFPINTSVRISQCEQVYILTFSVYAPYDSWGGDPTRLFQWLEKDGYIRTDGQKTEK